MKQNMIFIALQNPDKQYENTRHNAGAILLCEIEKEYSEVLYYKNIKVYYSDEYMNLSGKFVSKILKKENLKPENLYIFLDDINLPIGKFIISQGVGASSHNGVKSVMEHLKSNDFHRVRIGVGAQSRNGKSGIVHDDKMSDIVLSDFTDDELLLLRDTSDSVLAKLLT